MRSQTSPITFVVFFSLCCLLMLTTACHQEPEPELTTWPTFTFERSFNDARTNQTSTATYPFDSLTYSATRFRGDLRIQLSPKKQLLEKDDITIRLDSTALLPGLVGDYRLPQLDTVTLTQWPSSLLVFYMHTTEYNSFQWVARTQSLYNFLPGSYLNLTSYDPKRQTISGRFEFRFVGWDPSRPPYLVNRNWRVTLKGEFANLLIK